MEEMSVLIARAQAGEKEAREVLIEKNLGLVHHIVKRFLGRGVEPEDLFQIGCIGLMKSVDKFDLSLGLRFSTYAVPMIAGEIKRFLRDDGPVKISRTIKENSGKIGQARAALQSSLGREPTLAELCAAAGLNTEEVVEALEAGAEVTSIYEGEEQADGSRLVLADSVVRGPTGSVGVSGNASTDGRDPEKEEMLNRMFVGQLLDTLTEQERELIRERYYQNRTQTEIAAHLGISQVQVSRQEKKILRMLRERSGM